jgi:hypothetical protein
MLINNHNEWKRSQENFRNASIKYYKFHEKLFGGSTSFDGKTRKFEKITNQAINNKYRQQLISNDNYDEQSIINYILQNNTKIINYQNLIDENDDFEQINDIKEICHSIHWNITNNYSPVYILKRFVMSNRIICSLNSPRNDVKYEHMCQYGMSN